MGARKLDFSGHFEKKKIRVAAAGVLVCRLNRFFEKMIKHPCVIYRWKEEEKNAFMSVLINDYADISIFSDMHMSAKN